MMPGHAQGELLAQVNPGVTTAQTLLAADELRIEVTLILVVNRDAGAVRTQLYHDDDGTTYGVANEIVRHSVAANSSEVLFQAQHPGSGIIIKPGGSLGIQVNVADDITLSVYGITETLADRVRGMKNG